MADSNDRQMIGMHPFFKRPKSIFSSPWGGDCASALTIEMDIEWKYYYWGVWAD